MENIKADPTKFHKQLLVWYKKHHRELPWRKTRDPYKIWISEVMLQQTTVKTVIPYYNKWIEQFPDIKTLSQAEIQKVLTVWQGLGYYQRAKNLHKTSRIIMENYDGRFPDDYKLVRELPGLGPYTAAAVLSIAFDKNYPVFDANVRRVVMRLAGFRREMGPGIDRILLDYISPYLPPKKMGEFNQAMMELGALVCRSKNPSCLLCPVTDHCTAYARGEQEVIPLPKKKSYQKIEAVIAVIKRQNHYLIQKRPSKGLLADLWEFPGGKRESGETLEQTLDREIKEELGTEILTKKYLTKVKHSYTHFQVTLHAYECTLKNLPLEKKGAREWVSLKNFDRFPFPSGSVRIIRELKKRNSVTP